MRILGRVQGVWYRGWTRDEATQRGLRGWVRNRRDGSVEALFAGPAAPVKDMTRACKQGTPAAKIHLVEAEAAEVPQQGGFVQRPTE